MLIVSQSLGHKKSPVKTGLFKINIVVIINAKGHVRIGKYLV